MIENPEKHIEENWFPEHRAKYADHGDLKVLTWRKPGTSMYAVRYVFDSGRMYVSGDLGEALFCFTELADVHIQSDYGLDYFESKLRAYHENRKDFNSLKAVQRLREWVRSLKEYDKQYDHDEMKELFNATRECSSTSEWTHILHDKHDFIEDLEHDYWEWMYNAGDEYPLRLRSYLVGLKMASRQLKEAQSHE